MGVGAPVKPSTETTIQRGQRGDVPRRVPALNSRSWPSSRTSTCVTHSAVLPGCVSMK